MNYDFEVHPKINSSQGKTNSGVVDIVGSGVPEIERTVLYGTDIRTTKAPAETFRTGAKYRVGFINEKREAFGLSEKMLSKHLLLLGGVGCGKTNVFNFIIEALLHRMTSDDVMIIFDTKGDFFTNFYRSNDSTHWLIGNDIKYLNISKCWNIFDELKNEKGEFDTRSELTAKEIASQLFEGRESSNQPFFADAAKDLVAMVMIHIMRKATKCKKENVVDTSTLVSFLKKSTTQEYYDIITDPDNPDFLNKVNYLGKPGEKMTAQALGVLATLNSMVNDLFIGVFAERRRSGSYSMQRIIKEKGKRVIFIEYDLGVGNTLEPMYRIMIDLALKEALGGRQNQRGNTYLIIDEFKLLPKLKHIDNALNFGRSMGVKVCAGIQSINQLYDIYGEAKGKVLAAGFMNSFCFQTWDLDSRKFIMERFGTTYETMSFRSRTTQVPVQREGHVVEDWDIMNLDIGEAYVNLNGYAPFKYKFEDFEKPHKIL